MAKFILHIHIFIQCWVGLGVSLSPTHAVGHRFVPQLDHTEDHHKNGTNCLTAWQASVKVGV